MWERVQGAEFEPGEMYEINISRERQREIIAQFVRELNTRNKGLDMFRDSSSTHE
jgi:hypothetical protein